MSIHPHKITVLVEARYLEVMEPYGGSRKIPKPACKFEVLTLTLNGSPKRVKEGEKGENPVLRNTRPVYGAILWTAWGLGRRMQGNRGTFGLKLQSNKI